MTFLPSFSWLSVNSRLCSCAFLRGFGKDHAAPTPFPGARQILVPGAPSSPHCPGVAQPSPPSQLKAWHPASMCSGVLWGGGKSPLRAAVGQGGSPRPGPCFTHLLHEPVGVPVVVPIVLGDRQASQGHQCPLHCCHVLGCRETERRKDGHSAAAPAPPTPAAPPPTPSKRSTVWNTSVLTTP